MSDARAASTFLNFPGDVRPVDGTQPMGPTTMGEPMWPVSAEYDATADRTRVGLSYIAPPAVTE